jgi:hypothetical protein
MKKLFFALIIIFTWGCFAPQSDPISEQFRELENLTVYSSNAAPDATISFQKDTVYGDTDEVLFGSIGEVAVDDLERVFITDAANMVIYAFEPNGRLIRRLGRDGRGPWEFSSYIQLQIRNNRLYAFDPAPNRVTVFTLDNLAGEKTILLGSNRREHQDLIGALPSINELHVRNDSTFVVRFIADNYVEVIKWQNFERKGFLYPLDTTGKIASGKLLEFTHAMHTHFPFRNAILGLHLEPFFGSAFTVLSSDNRIHFVEPDYFLIRSYHQNGVYQHAFYYSLEKIPITRPLSQDFAIQIGIPELLTDDINSMELPETWPVLTDMKIDDHDRFWIAITVGNMKVYEWWVLKENGELITKFEWPRDEPIEVVKNGYMYTRQTDEETGLQQIVRYRIELEEV